MGSRVRQCRGGLLGLAAVVGRSRPRPGAGAGLHVEPPQVGSAVGRKVVGHAGQLRLHLPGSPG